MKLLNKITKGMHWAVVLLLMALPVSLFGQVEVSLPDTALKAGETIEVPIYVSNMNETDGVVSGEFEFNFNESYFDITGINKTGTILESVGSVLYFEGTDRLAFASTDSVSGEGVLVKLLVKGNDDADYFRNSNLTFTSAKLNEGDPAINATDGSLRILGVRISPKSNIQITNGDTLQFTLQEDVTNPVSWSVTDTDIASIDANGQLIAKTTGTVQVKGVDAEGLKDSTSFFTILPNAFTDFTVSMPDTSTTQTLYLDLPIRTSEVTGLGITSAEFDISFSNNYFSLDEVLPGPLTSAWSAPTVNIDNDRVRIAGAGTDSLEGSGDLYILRFKVTDNNSGNSTISFNSGIFNEDLSSDLENATVYVNNAPDINVFPSDTAVSIGNSLSFEVTGGNGTAPYTWESSDAGIGDIDASTGVLTGVSRGDIIVNARDAENFPSDLVNVRVNDFDAYLDSLELNYPDTVVLGLYTNELSSYSVYAYETKFRYDTTHLEFLGTDVTNTQTESAGLSTEVRDSLNYIRIAAAGTSALSGNDPIIKFKFAPKNAVADGDSLKIDLRYLNFNEPSPTVPTTTAIPGLITIQRINPPGAITLSSPSDNFSEADTSITFEWVEDAEADEYRIQLSTDDQFSTTLYNEVVSQSMIQLGSLDFSTTYYWRVLGINQGGEGAWSDVYSFTTFDGLPEIVDLLSPQDGDNEVEINTDLIWNAATLADEYKLQLSTESDFSTFIKDSSAITDTSVSVALDYETHYYWRVRSVNAQGESLDWSQTFDFTTQIAPPDIPALLQPQDGETGVDTLANLRWNEAARADSFSVQLASDDTFNDILFEQSGVDTTANVGGLDFTTEYFWRVKASNSTGESGWSTSYSFTTKAPDASVPTLQSPANNATDIDTTLTFEWSTAEHAESYQFQLSEQMDFTSLLSDSSGHTQTTFEADGLDYSTTYYWRVRTIGLTDTSDWSSVFNFTTKIETPAIPQLLEPADQQADVDTALTLVWYHASRADSFMVQVSAESDFSTTLIEEFQEDTTLNVDGLSHESEYFWRVKASNSTGESGWSSEFSFTTKEKANQPPAIVNPLGTITLDEDFGEVTAAVFDSVFTDPEGEVLTYEIIEFNSSLFNTSLNADTLTLSSLQDEYGSGMVVVKATDIENAEIMDTLLVEITSINDLPEFTHISDSAKFRNDEDFTLQLDTSITDVEDLLDDLTIEAEADPADIVVSYDADNYIVTLSAPGFSGEGTLTITVTDSDGGEVSVTIVVVVEMSTSNELLGDIPDHFDLLQNYPNPFNPATQIRFGLPEATEVKIEVFSMLGQKVATLANKRFTAGKHKVQFEAGALSSGMYIYRIQAGDFVKTKKMTLIK